MNFAAALRSHIGKEVFVFVGLRDSTGRLGRVIEVGEDYLEIGTDNQQTYYIPFSSILAVTPKGE